MSNEARSPHSRRLIVVSAAVAVAVAWGLVVHAGAPAPAAQDVVVSPNAETRQPRILDGRVYSISSSGDDVVVAGTFTRVRVGRSNEPVWTQPRLFRFDKSTGAIDYSFVPDIDGDVEAVTYTADGRSLLIAGNFTTVNGQRARRIAKLNLDGSLASGFEASAGARVKDFALTDGRLIIGGKFGRINNQQVRGLAAIDPDTGDLDPTFDLPIADSRYQYPPYVQELDVDADGRWLIIGGNFGRVGNATRHQVAVIDLSGVGPVVADWTTNRYQGPCAAVYADTYIRDVDVSPDSNYFVVTTTGAFRGNTTLCDTAARWELPPTGSGSGQQPSWVHHTGGDTLWQVEVTDAAVYIGGHQRWGNNPHPSPGGDNDGPGSVARSGIAALDPSSGVPLSWNPGRHRGRGVEALYATDDYLMVGHDTAYFGGRLRQRLALLPVSGGTDNPAPQDVMLPVRLFAATGSDLLAMSFDGNVLGQHSVVSGPSSDGLDWSGTRDGFVQHDRLHYFGPSRAFYSRSFNGTDTGATTTNLSTSVGYVDNNANLTPYDQPFGVAETRTAAFKDGRVFYTRTNSSDLFYRGLSLESGILEGYEWTASTENWSGARAMEFVGGYLYVGWSDNRLYRFRAPDGFPHWNSRVQIDNGNTSGVPWASTTGLWARHNSAADPPPETGITEPGRHAAVHANPVTVRGTATDNLGVVQVRVAIRDRVAKKWLQPDGSWAPRYAFRLATLADPRAPTTDWAVNITLPVGRYGVDARARDTASTVDPTSAWVPFERL